MEQNHPDGSVCPADVLYHILWELEKDSVWIFRGRRKLLYDCSDHSRIPERRKRRTGDYTGQEEDVETVGVKAVLLAGDQLSEDTVKMITAGLFSHTAELKQAIPVDFSFTPETAAESIPVPFHKGAAAYYKEQGVTVTEEQEVGIW